MRLSRNVGSPDRVIRLAMAAALAVSAITGIAVGPLAIVAWVLAGVLLVTAATGFCPIYALFGVGTCAIRR